MKRMTGGVALAATVMVLMPLQAEAQRGARGQGQMMNRQAQPGVEHIMRLRDRLELSENQINQLDAVRRDMVQFRSGHQAAAAELRSQVMAGQIEADAAREQTQARREGGEAFHEDVKARLESILTEDQRDELGDIAAQARAFQRGRASAQRGGQRGFRRDQGARGGHRGGQSQGQGAWGQGTRGPGAWGQGARGQQRGPDAPGRMMRRGGGGPGFTQDTLPPPPPPVG